MATRLLPLALAVAMMAGCAQNPIPGTAGRPAPAPVVAAAPAGGYGTVTVNVTGLGQAMRQTATFQGVAGAKARVVLLVYKDGTSDLEANLVKDVASKPAAYLATLTNGTNVTVNIPALPSTTTSTLTAVNSGSPYVFKVRAFTGGETDANLNQTVTTLGENDSHVKTDSGAEFTALTTLTNTKMKASGEAKAHVVAGLPVIVTIDSSAHFGANFDNTVDPKVRAVTLAGASTVDETPTAGILRTRITKLEAAKLGVPKAKATFTVTGTGAGDKIRINVTDNQNPAKTYFFEHTVTSGQSVDSAAASLASGVTNQAVAGAGASAAFNTGYVGQASGAEVTLEAKSGSAAFNFNVATVGVAPLVVKDYTLAVSGKIDPDGAATLSEVWTLPVALTPQEGDKITITFDNQLANSGPFVATHTVKSSDDTRDKLAASLATALETADGSAPTADDYTFAASTDGSGKITVTAGSNANLKITSGPTVETVRTTTVSSVTKTNVVKRFRVLLNFPTAVDGNTLWTLTDNGGNPVKDTLGRNITNLIGTKLFEDVKNPVPAKANTQHWVDVDDDTASRIFPDGSVDIKVTGVPRNYTNIKIVDMVLADGDTSSTTVK